MSSVQFTEDEQEGLMYGDVEWMRCYREESEETKADGRGGEEEVSDYISDDVDFVKCQNGKIHVETLEQITHILPRRSADSDDSAGSDELSYPSATEASPEPQDAKLTAVQKEARKEEENEQLLEMDSENAEIAYMICEGLGLSNLDLPNPSRNEVENYLKTLEKIETIFPKAQQALEQTEIYEKEYLQNKSAFNDCLGDMIKKLMGSEKKDAVEPASKDPEIVRALLKDKEECLAELEELIRFRKTMFLKYGERYEVIRTAANVCNFPPPSAAHKELTRLSESISQNHEKLGRMMERRSRVIARTAVLSEFLAREKSQTEALDGKVTSIKEDIEQLSAQIAGMQLETGGGTRAVVRGNRSAGVVVDPAMAAKYRFIESEVRNMERQLVELDTDMEVQKPTWRM